MDTGSPSATSLKGKGECGVRKLAAYCGHFMCYKAQSIQTSPQHWIPQEQVNHQRITGCTPRAPTPAQRTERTSPPTSSPACGHALLYGVAKQIC